MLKHYVCYACDNMVLELHKQAVKKLTLLHAHVYCRFSSSNSSVAASVMHFAACHKTIFLCCKHCTHMCRYCMSSWRSAECIKSVASCGDTDSMLGLFGMQTSARLRGVLPVVVDADYWEDIGEVLDDIFIPEAEIW